MKQILVILSAVLLLASCRPETYIPKPRGYYRVDYPKREYQAFTQGGFPFVFEYPVYATINKDTASLNEAPENPYWLNIDYPTLGGQVFLTYKEIKPDQTYEQLITDAYKMSYFHDKRADYINDEGFSYPDRKVFGSFFHVGGDAATNYQFFVTDSSKHFIWCSLYFNVTPNKDSLAPIAAFIRKDMDHMVQTLKWTR